MTPDISKAWRPFEPSREQFTRRFFKCDDSGCYWIGVARDRDHFIQLLREQGAEWEVDVDGGPTRPVGIDVVVEHNLVDIIEINAETLSWQHRRCHTEDERGVIPLAEAAIGDLFCSEW